MRPQQIPPSTATYDLALCDDNDAYQKFYLLNAYSLTEIYPQVATSPTQPASHPTLLISAAKWDGAGEYWPFSGHQKLGPITSVGSKSYQFALAA
jgi:hypothetical protein